MDLRGLQATGAAHASRPVLAVGTPRSGTRQPMVDMMFGATLQLMNARRRSQANNSNKEEAVAEAREQALELEAKAYVETLGTVPRININSEMTPIQQQRISSSTAVERYKKACLVEVKLVATQAREAVAGMRVGSAAVAPGSSSTIRSSGAHASSSKVLPVSRPGVVAGSSASSPTASAPVPLEELSPEERGIVEGVVLFVDCVRGASTGSTKKTIDVKGCPQLPVPREATDAARELLESRQSSIQQFFEVLLLIWNKDTLVSGCEALRLESIVFNTTIADSGFFSEDSDDARTRFVNIYELAIIAGLEALSSTALPRNVSEVESRHQSIVRHRASLISAAGAKRTSSAAQLGDANERATKAARSDGPVWKCGIDELLLTKTELKDLGYPTRQRLEQLLSEKSVSPIAYARTRSVRSDSFEGEEHTCTRCANKFFYEFTSTDNVEDIGRRKLVPRPRRCVYHEGKLVFRRSTLGREESKRQYSCCGQDVGSTGCASGEHVWGGTEQTDSFEALVADGVAFRMPWDDGHNAASDTVPSGRWKTRTSAIFAIDCEMIYTTRGFEIARVSLVNFEGQLILDRFIRPAGEVVDYNTRFSGVTEDMLKSVTTTLEEVQMELLVSPAFAPGSVLVGQSLDSDLKAMRLVHERIADTSMLFPHKLAAYGRSKHKLELEQQEIEKAQGNQGTDTALLADSPSTTSETPKLRIARRALRDLAREYLGRKIQVGGSAGHDSLEDAVASLDLVKLKMQRGKQFGTAHVE